MKAVDGAMAKRLLRGAARAHPVVASLTGEADRCSMPERIHQAQEVEHATRVPDREPFGVGARGGRVRNGCRHGNAGEREFPGIASG
jgi:hypothetical protein